MKTFFAVIAVAAVALAQPESDPALLYNNYYGAPWAYNYAAPYAYAAAPAVYNSYAAYNTYAGWPYNYNLGYRLFKREAEADSDADANPALLYSSFYGAPWAYNYAAPYAYSAAPAVYSAYNTYAGWPYNYGAPYAYARYF